MNTQDKFTSLLEKAIPDHLQMIDNRKYSNTGTILIQPHDTFECFLSIRYDFQDTYCTFEITPIISTHYRVEESSNMVYIPTPYEKLTRLINDITEYLLR